jgi:hypothetical protein
MILLGVCSTLFLAPVFSPSFFFPFFLASLPDVYSFLSLPIPRSAHVPASAALCLQCSRLDCEAPFSLSQILNFLWLHFSLVALTLYQPSFGTILFSGYPAAAFLGLDNLGYRPFNMLFCSRVEPLLF